MGSERGFSASMMRRVTHAFLPAWAPTFAEQVEVDGRTSSQAIRHLVEAGGD